MSALGNTPEAPMERELKKEASGLGVRFSDVFISSIQFSYYILIS
jgi:hypothetical protein